MKKEMSLLFIMMIITFLAVFVILYKGINLNKAKENEVNEVGYGL